jgi:hypothetical protein
MCRTQRNSLINMEREQPPLAYLALKGVACCVLWLDMGMESWTERRNVARKLVVTREW